MKKTILFFISFISLFNYSIGQKPAFGITSGATFGSYKIKAGSFSVTSKIKPGFSAGVQAWVPTGKSFSFIPALNFIQKGGTLKEEGSEEKTTLNYIEIPFNVVYNTSSTKGTFFIGAGPSLSYGISGKDKWKSNGQNGDDKIKFGSGDEDHFKPFEMGINLLAGYRFKGGFMVSGNYNIGLSDSSKNSNEIENTSYHNSYFGISIGYIFSGNKK